MADNGETGDDMERHVLRFRDLDGRESPWKPLDTKLERFERERYSVIGRPAEGTGEGKSVEDVEAFNVTYLKCEPGKGIGGHAHATAEVFIAMSGRWSVTLGPDGEREAIVEPWDIVAVPPDEMHGAVNISDETGWLMTINAGHGGAKIHWARDVLEGVRAMGIEPEEAEQPGEPQSG